MAPHNTSRSDHALSDWLRRHDWTLYETATSAVEQKEAFTEGLSDVKKSQLRAVINTARMCSSPSTFKGFLEKRAERRRSSGETTKANFWRALADEVDDVQDEHAAPAVTAAGFPETGTEAAEMRVVRTYFEHLISHCHVAGQ
jgi:hypothetical protein